MTPVRETPAPAATVGETVRGEGPGVLAWAVGLWAMLLGALAGVGLLITGPLATVWPVDVEDELSSDLEQGRTAVMNSVTQVWSMIGNTEIIIISTAVAALIVRLCVDRWREPLFLVACVAGQALVFVLCTLLVDRDRPDVEKLDPAPPTSGYPSGHVGASVALYVGIAVLVLHLVQRRWVRIVVPLLCVVVPFLVGYARLYRGMHHASDIVLGIANGLVCVWIAWALLLRDHPPRDGAPR